MGVDSSSSFLFDVSPSKSYKARLFKKSRILACDLLFRSNSVLFPSKFVTISSGGCGMAVFISGSSVVWGKGAAVTMTLAITLSILGG